MSELLGKIERPLVEEFKKGRKILFVPLVYCGKDSPPEYVGKYKSYWPPVENQIAALESKLGRVKRVYHEMVPVGGEEGLKALKALHEESYRIVRARIDEGAQLEAAEDTDLLTEFLDWGRCLSIGLQNQRVFTMVYQSYLEAGKKRHEHIARRIDTTLKADEIGVLFMREGHRVQFPPDIQVFYISPPELDELNRWLRDQEAKSS